MDPQQQFSEINAKYSKFVPGTPESIPSIGIKNLKTLEFQQVNSLWFSFKCKSDQFDDMYLLPSLNVYGICIYSSEL